jgi:cell wall assembly regulator SMI1
MTIHDFMEMIERILTPEFPDLIASLRPPATEAQIARVETVIGRALPEDYKELYRLHNGASDINGLFFGPSFIDLEQVERNWRMWDELSHDETLWELDLDCTSIPHGWIQERYICQGWIPFASNGDGNYLGVDLDPGPEGIYGQVINFGRDEEEKYVIAPNLTLFFQLMAALLEHGNYRVGDDNELLLTEPADHLLEGLNYWRLPYGMPRTTGAEAPAPEMPFEAWYAALDSRWQSMISKRIELPGAGYDDLANMTYFAVLDDTISNIGPLSYFTGLRELILSGTQVSDLSPLRACRLLKTLYLSKTPVTDLSPLSELANLTTLSLYHTGVTDLSPLYGLTELTILDVDETPFSDLDQLLNLHGLSRLDLSDHQFASFAPLSQFKRLRSLDLSRTNFTDLTLLTSLPHLMELDISDTPITDFEPLGLMPIPLEVTCGIDAFLRIKDIVKHKIHFKISGEMTDNQRHAWLNSSHNQ